jgi:hypothetical protein
MKYIIKFFSEYKVDEDEYYIKGHIIEVNKAEMFHWIEKSKNENIAIMVYETQCVLDLT